MINNVISDVWNGWRECRSNYGIVVTHTFRKAQVARHLPRHGHETRQFLSFSLFFLFFFFFAPFLLLFCFGFSRSFVYSLFFVGANFAYFISFFVSFFLFDNRKEMWECFSADPKCYQKNFIKTALVILLLLLVVAVSTTTKRTFNIIINGIVSFVSLLSIPPNYYYFYY